jgi:hypothetical protein
MPSVAAASPAIPKQPRPDALVAAAIARAERRREKLEELSTLGMGLAREFAGRAERMPEDAEPRHDPARAFASVSRAVRLTLAHEARIDPEILALGNSSAPSCARAAAPRKPAAEKPAPESLPAIVFGPEAVRVRDTVWSAIEVEFGAFDGAMEALDELHERLTDRETQETIVSRSWRDSVEAICADLGLPLDWSRWSDETGFAGEPGKPRVKWNMLWTYDPKRSEQRRRKRQGAGPPPDG